MEKQKDNNEETPIGITKEQLNAFKKLHGDIKSVYVKDDKGDILAGWFKKPDFDLIQLVESKVEADPLGAGKLMFNSLKLHVDPLIEADGILMASVMSGLSDLFKARTVELKSW